MDQINVRIGNTDFMKSYWNNIDLNLDSFAPGSTEIPVNYSMGYQKDGPMPDFEEAVRQLHMETNNCSVNGKHIVVGNGATQLLHAAMYAMKKTKGVTKVVAQAPYYFRFPDMAKESGLQFSAFTGADQDLTFSMEILTVPNNPDNQVRDEVTTNSIVDACYNWPQYSRMCHISGKAIIFGLAKATGHAGTRVGWAVVDDYVFARHMTHYIEITTGGVSVDSQLRATKIINTQLGLRSNQTSVFQDGASVLAFRWKKLLAALPRDIKALNSNGMFLWGEIDGPWDAEEFFLANYDMVIMDGRSCGGTNKNFRINVGCDDRTFNLMIERFNGSKP